jgi:hypothetical protein
VVLLSIIGKAFELAGVFPLEDNGVCTAHTHDGSQQEGMFE